LIYCDNQSETVIASNLDDSLNSCRADLCEWGSLIYLLTVCYDMYVSVSSKGGSDTSSLYASATAKAEIFRERYAILYQV
jgi:hypothetical protein